MLIRGPQGTAELFEPRGSTCIYRAHLFIFSCYFVVLLCMARWCVGRDRDIAGSTRVRFIIV